MTRTTEHVWRKFSKSLRAFIGKRISDPHEAEDILQETFIKVHDKLAGLKEGDKVEAWVYRIARNTIIDHYRRRRPAAAPVEAGDVEEKRGDETLDRLVASWLTEMMADLPENDRQVLRLTDVEGLTQKQVGERLGLSFSGSKSRVQRAREKLKGLLLDCCHLEFDSRGGVIDYKKNKRCC